MRTITSPKKPSLKVIITALLLVIVIVIISAFIIVDLEQGYPGSKIKTFSDGLWWAAVGISTIGIGTFIPLSPLGKVLNILLMITGLGIFSVITAIIASLFTEEEVKTDIAIEEKQLQSEMKKEDTIMESENKEILQELEKIEERLDHLEKK